jgi:hypothetical protein
MKCRISLLHILFAGALVLTQACSSSGSAGSGAGGSSTGGDTGTGGAGGMAVGGLPGSGGSTHTGVWNVMMLGDSVTQSTCYPQLTYQQLQAANHTNFQFVGTQTTNQSCGGQPTSVKDEGHGGYGVTYLPMNSTRSPCTKSTGCGSYAELQTWAAEAPDIVFMHYGTNDVWDGISTSTILSAYVAVIAEFRKQNPNVIFFVSKIIKLSPTSNSTATSPVYVIDHYGSDFDPTNTADTADGVHPTPAGAAIMATVTADAIATTTYF